MREASACTRNPNLFLNRQISCIKTDVSWPWVHQSVVKEATTSKFFTNWASPSKTVKNAIKFFFIRSPISDLCHCWQGDANKRQSKLVQVFHGWHGITSANDDHVVHFAFERNSDGNKDRSIDSVAAIHHSNSENYLGIVDIHIDHHLHEICCSSMFRSPEANSRSVTTNATSDSISVHNFNVNNVPISASDCY